MIMKILLDYFKNYIKNRNKQIFLSNTICRRLWYEKENLFSEFSILCALQGLLENVFSQADRAFIQKPDHDIVAMVYYFLKKNKRRFKKAKSQVSRKISRYFPYSDAINESMVKWVEKL